MPDVNMQSASTYVGAGAAVGLGGDACVARLLFLLLTSCGNTTTTTRGLPQVGFVRVCRDKGRWSGREGALCLSPSWAPPSRTGTRPPLSPTHFAAAHTPDAHQGHHYISTSPSPSPSSQHVSWWGWRWMGQAKCSDAPGGHQIGINRRPSPSTSVGR